jgi:hypothetical protein
MKLKEHPKLDRNEYRSKVGWEGCDEEFIKNMREN